VTESQFTDETLEENESTGNPLGTIKRTVVNTSMNMAESSYPGPADDYYRYLQEKKRRLHAGEAMDSPLNQELAFVRNGVVIADLKLLMKEGTFPQSERFVSKENAELPITFYREMLEKSDRRGVKGMFNIEDTNWNILDQQVNTFVTDNPAILKKLGITSINALDPATATILAFEITNHYLAYDEEMAKTLTGDATLEADRKSADQLIVEGKGICRHFTKVAVAIYERLRQLDKTGSLTDTVLLPVGNMLMDDLPGGHAYTVLVGRRSETVISVGDPTFYRQDYPEVHSDTRLASLVATLIDNNLLNTFNIDRETLIGFVDEQLGRIDKRVNFQKKRKTDAYIKANKDQIPENDYIREHGFDERANHIFQNGVSVLQVVYALNAAKALAQDKTSKHISEQHLEIATDNVFDFIDNHSAELSEQTLPRAIERIFEISPRAVNLSLLKRIVTRLLELPKPHSDKTTGNILQSVRDASDRLRLAVVHEINPDDIWAEPITRSRYKSSEFAELQNKLEDLSTKWQ
jgi:hypothetical protein